MEFDYKPLEKILRHHLRSYRDNERYEDAIQEALLRAWRDVQDGSEDVHHIINRAKLWGRAFLQKPGARPTGAPPLSRDGKMREEGEIARHKIMAFNQEFRKLHDRKPTNKEMANGLGMSLTKVAQHRINIAKGHYDHAVYTEDTAGRRRLADSYFKPSHLDAMLSDEGASQSEKYIVELGFEEGLIGEMDFLLLLNRLPEETRKPLYLHYNLGYSLVECSQILGITQKIFYTRMEKAKREVQALLDPEFAQELAERLKPKCRNGHDKPEGGGRCKICIQAYEVKRAAGRKRGKKNS